MAVDNDNRYTRLILDRIREHIRQTSPTNEKVKAALMRIGMLVVARAKRNVLKAKPMVKNKGALHDSIDYKFARRSDLSVLVVGSFGIKYAAMNEFGTTQQTGPISERQRRAMFWAMSKARQQRPPRQPPVVYRDGSGQLQWRARPYLRPALDETAPEITQTLNDLVKRIT